MAQSVDFKDSQIYPNSNECHSQSTKSRYINKKVEQLDEASPLGWCVVAIVIGAMIGLTGIGVGTAALVHTLNISTTAAGFMIGGSCLVGGIIVADGSRKIALIKKQKQESLPYRHNGKTDSWAVPNNTPVPDDLNALKLQSIYKNLKINHFAIKFVNGGAYILLKQKVGKEEHLCATPVLDIASMQRLRSSFEQAGFTHVASFGLES